MDSVSNLTLGQPDGYADNGGVRLAYWDRGTGEKTVLLIMGIQMRAEHWGTHFIDRLAQRFRVICFDNRGTGHSTKPVAEISAELWAKDALAVLDAVGVERACVVGTSMGGRVTQQLLVDHSERVERAVLVSSAVGGPNAVPPTKAALDSFSPPADLDPAIARRNGMIAVTAPGFADRNPSAIDELTALSARKRTPVAVLLQQIQVIQTNVCERLPFVRVPTMIVHGDADPLVPFENGQEIKRLMPNAFMVTLAGCGHLPAWEAPTPLLDAVIPFLESRAN